MTQADEWGSLEIRHLRAFLTVARQQSFSGAARELGYTQSAISQQLHALERIVGAPLFTRTPGGRQPVELTEPGSALRVHAEAVVSRIAVARADLNALVSGESGTLRVITIQSFGARILPEILARFRSLWPNVRVQIQEARSMPEVAHAVESAAADIAFGSLPKPPGPLAIRQLLAEPYVLATRAGAELGSLTELRGQRLLGIRGCALELMVEQRLWADGIAPSTCERFDDNSLIQALVAAGEGAAIVPALVLDEADSRISIRPLSEIPARQLAAMTHSERRRPAAIARFLEVTSEVCVDLANAPTNVLHLSTGGLAVDY